MVVLRLKLVSVLWKPKWMGIERKRESGLDWERRVAMAVVYQVLRLARYRHFRPAQLDDGVGHGCAEGHDAS